MPQVGSEPTIPAFERAKTVYAFDLEVTVIDVRNVYYTNFYVETDEKRNIDFYSIA
jgi:hypothetical protein